MNGQSNITSEEEKEIARLREYAKSTTRWMSEEEQDRLTFLINKQIPVKYKDCSRCGTPLGSDLVCPMCNF